MSLKSPEISGFHGIIRTAPKSACNTLQGLTRSTGTSSEGLPVMVPKICSVDGCDKPWNSRRLCRGHYSKFSRAGQLPSFPTDAERFWPKVDKSGPCWLWTAAINPKGYGTFRADGRSWRAHRYSYVLHYGEIPDAMLIDHRCHVRSCVNPAHLRVVTNKQNEENRVGANRTSVSGVRGVHWDNRAQKWLARASHLGKTYDAGHFEAIEEAEAAVIALRLELFTHNDLDRRTA